MNVVLRELTATDLDQVFVWGQDPAAIALAAFTRPDPSDRAAFDAHHARIRDDARTTLRAIEVDGTFVGTVGSFTMDGEREVTYWVDRAHWGRGVASAALVAFLADETTRPLHARVAAHNTGSARVLEKAGFVRYGEETSYAAGVDRDVVEHLYRLISDFRQG